MKPLNGTPSTHGRLARPDARERMQVLRYVLLPAVAGGAIIRRPGNLATAARRDWDGKGVQVSERLHERYGAGPLMLLGRGRPAALVLDPGDSTRLLEGTPEPFSAAPWEKHAALSQFQPHGVLISEGRERTARRHLNEQVLDTGKAVHSLADRLTRIVREEAGDLVEAREAGSVVGWEEFDAAWWRAVRRITLGDAARHDTVITDQLNKLRAAGNWAMLSPRRRLLRAAFSRRLAAYADRAEHGTLIARARAEGLPDGTDPVGQVPHWLFAYDAAGWATWRTFALLATHPAEATRARQEAEQARRDGSPMLPFLRACAMESVRLWPTTPLILRESREETQWHGRTVPAGTLFVIYAPYLHRSATAGDARDRFAPQSWLEGAAPTNPALLPFSAGPAGCPGQDLVLLTMSAWLAESLAGHSWSLESSSPPADLGPDRPLPAGINHYGLEFAVHPAGDGA
ncbi:cytochrome P450 [Streptomyces sp. 549]|uniref:cytochrome P450 n=1 Tax=Streptomyces sp. 549 TaxID=3049076 RepID=UPI0024C2881C|nr:cytochrome P450 [Streptomyces sp. 549]MDK1471942.1 cytochrome P450 [Streptomyces sp. 549]